MKRLAFSQFSRTPPKSSAAAASCAIPIFRGCPKSNLLNFVALRSDSIKKQSFYTNSSSHRRQMAATGTGEITVSASVAAIRLKPIEATAESFREFGQVVEASPDGDEFGPRDAQLDLSRGVPRFYIMHIEDRPLEFSTITHHASVTQCLGSVGGGVWYLGVAPPSLVDPAAEKAVKSRCGHSYIPPPVDSIRVFKISGPKFVKLNRGTWHAGPLFREKGMDFYNLELSDTNVVDHTMHDFAKEDHVVFVFDQ